MSGAKILNYLFKIMLEYDINSIKTIASGYEVILYSLMMK